jgi:hypothetical protein
MSYPLMLHVSQLPCSFRLGAPLLIFLTRSYLGALFLLLAPQTFTISRATAESVLTDAEQTLGF